MMTDCEDPVLCPRCNTHHYENLCCPLTPETQDDLVREQRNRRAHDPVHRPRHYTNHPSGVECITITRHMGFNLGNAMKYIWRADLKNGIEDLEKALWYITDEIAKRKEYHYPPKGGPPCPVCDDTSGQPHICGPKNGFAVTNFLSFVSGLIIGLAIGVAATIVLINILARMG